MNRSTRFALALLGTLIGMIITAPAAQAAVARPNLAVSAASAVPASVASGASTTIRASVINRGTAVAPASVTTLLLSSNRSREASDTVLARIATRRAAPKGFVPLRRAVTIPTGTIAGAWFVLVCTDAASRIRELNERDNCRAIALKVTAPAVTGPGAGVGTGPGAGVPPTKPGITFVRDDSGVQAQLAAAGDILLERYIFGASGQTADYWRVWIYANGSFVYNVISWNSVGGETCTASHRGSWSYLEGYTFAEGGGGVVLKLQLSTPTLSGPEIFIFGASEPNNVYVGTQSLQFEKNPNMMDNCG